MKTVLVLLSWLAGLAGFGLLVFGVALFHLPSAFIVSGTGLLAWAWRADQAAAQLKRGG